MHVEINLIDLFYEEKSEKSLSAAEQATTNFLAQRSIFNVPITSEFILI